MDNRICAQGERLLQVGGGKGVVDHQHGAVAVGQLSHGGDVDDPQQGVRRGLHPHHPGLRGEGRFYRIEVVGGDRLIGRGRRGRGPGRQGGRSRRRHRQGSVGGRLVAAGGAARLRPPSRWRRPAPWVAPSRAARHCSRAERVGLAVRL